MKHRGGGHGINHGRGRGRGRRRGRGRGRGRGTALRAGSSRESRKKLGRQKAKACSAADSNLSISRVSASPEKTPNFILVHRSPKNVCQLAKLCDLYGGVQQKRYAETIRTVSKRKSDVVSSSNGDKLKPDNSVKLSPACRRRAAARAWYSRLSNSARRRRQILYQRQGALAIRRNRDRARRRYQNMTPAQRQVAINNAAANIKSSIPRYRKFSDGERKKVIETNTERIRIYGSNRRKHEELSPEHLKRERVRQLTKSRNLPENQITGQAERWKKIAKQKRQMMSSEKKSVFIKYKAHWRNKKKFSITNRLPTPTVTTDDEDSSAILSVLEDVVKRGEARKFNRSWQWLFHAVRKRLLTSWLQQVRSVGGFFTNRKQKQDIIAKRVSAVIQYIDIILVELRQDLKYLQNRFLDGDFLVSDASNDAGQTVLTEYYGCKRYHSKADEASDVSVFDYLPFSEIDFTDPMNPSLCKTAVDIDFESTADSIDGVSTTTGLACNDDKDSESGPGQDNLAFTGNPNKISGCDSQGADSERAQIVPKTVSSAADTQNLDVCLSRKTCGVSICGMRSCSVQLNRIDCVGGVLNELNDAHADQPTHPRGDPPVRLCTSDCLLPRAWALKLHLFLKGINFNKPLDTLKWVVESQSCIPCTNGTCSADRHTCSDIMNVLNSVKHHFSGIRSMVRRLNSVKQKFGILMEADREIMKFDWRSFSQFYITRCKSVIDANNKDFQNPGASTTAEELETRYRKQFQSFQEELQSNLSIHACYSCDRLVRASDLKSVEKAPCLNKPGSKTIWQRLVDDMVKEGHGRPYLLCKTCYNSVTLGELPRFSRLNGMRVADDQLFKNLNAVEKILIQRVKPFQNIVHLMPYRRKHRVIRLTKGIKGLAIHLPLPDGTVSETLANYTLPCLDHLVILVECPPSRRDMLYRYKVDMNAVVKALEECKRINRFYETVTIRRTEQDLQLPISTIEPDLQETVLDESFAATSGDPEQTTILELSSASRSLVGFSVQRVDYEEPRESSVDLYKLGRVSASPVFESEPNLDVMSFPHLFPDGNFGLNYARERKLGDADYIKARMNHKSGRFRRDSAFVFFNAQLRDIKAISSGIFSTLRVGQAGGLTAASFRKALHVPESEVDKGLLSVLSQVRGTSQYCLQRYSDFAAMDEQIGPATWFSTFSCAEYKWDDLHMFLLARNRDLAHLSHEDLCAEDIGSVCVYFFQKFLALLNVICSSDGPLGDVIHYAYRLEYQTRGAPHVHCKFWVRDAPVVGVASDFEILQFVQRYISCAIPEDPRLAEKVLTYQIHHCTPSCLRKKSTGRQVFQHCRYGFPRAVCKAAKLNSMAEVAKSRAQTGRNIKLVEIPRRYEERFVNDYNPALLLLWDANIDIQFIGEESMLLNHYITGYISKAEKNATDDVWAALDPSKSIHSRLYSFARANLKNREQGEYEAFDKCMGTPLFGTSIPIKFTSTAMRNERKRRLKNSYLMDQLEDESTDIFFNNVTDVYYPKRPECERFESMCLMDYVCNYDIVKAKDFETFSEKTSERQWPLCDGLGYARLRRQPCIFKTNFYQCTTNDQIEKYFHSLLMSHWPWRDEAELISGFASYQASFLAKKDQMERLKAADTTKRTLAKALAWVGELIKNEEVDVANSSESGADVWQRQQLTEPLLLSPPSVDQNVLDAMVGSLNERQKMCFDKVMKKLDQQDGIIAGPTEVESLKLFISGMGGSGKSHVIDALKLAVQRRYEGAGEQMKQGVFVTVAAPTGVAAKNVEGSTLHRLLKLPIQHGADPKYYKLGSEVVKQLRVTFKDLRLLIIDEISMVSNASLLYIDLRLREIFDGEKAFGGINLVVLGDLLQLRPVFSAFVYETISKSKVRLIHGGNSEYNIWPVFDYVELTENMRQRDDLRYSELLSRARLGALNMADIKLLNDRVLCVGHQGRVDVRGNLGDYATACSIEQCAEFFVDTLLNQDPKALSLAGTNDAVHRFNNHCMKHLGLKPVFVKAKDFGGKKVKFQKISERQQKALKASETGGLETELTIAVGGRVMLRRNLSQEKGLVNGSLGTVTGINYRTVNHQRTVYSISVKFDDTEKIEEVKTVRTEFNGSGFRGRIREQFPLCAAYCITIHKSQGLSLDTVMLDIGYDCFEEAMAYVGLSRCRKMKNLYLMAFEPARVVCAEKSVMQYNDLREKYCPDIPKYVDWNTIGGSPRRVIRRPIRIFQEHKSSQTSKVYSAASSTAHPSPAAPAAVPMRPPLLMFEQDSNSCFADAALHVMFSMQKIWNDYLIRDNNILDSEMKRLWNLWKVPGKENSMVVRQQVGEEFESGIQCDFWDFLSKLMDKCSESVQKAISCRTDLNYTCVNCGQQSTVTPPPADFIFPSLRVHLSEISFASLLAQVEHHTRTCDGCGVKGPHTSRNSYRGVGGARYIIVRIQKFYSDDAGEPQIIDTKISNLITGSQSVSGSRYKVVSAVQHMGEDMNFGHYVAWLRSAEFGWYRVDGLTNSIEIRRKFIPNLENVVCLVLEKIA